MVICANSGTPDAWIGLMTVLTIALIAVTAKGIWQRLPVIIDVVAGHLTALAATPWVGQD